MGEGSQKKNERVRERETGGKTENETKMRGRDGGERGREQESEDQGEDAGSEETTAVLKRERKFFPSLPASGELKLIKWFHYCPPLLLR